MTVLKSPLQLTTPPTLEKKLEALAALRTLQAQDEELVRQRRAAIAALRHDVGELQRDFPAFCRQIEIELAELRRLLKYNPDPPRVSIEANAEASAAKAKSIADVPATSLETRKGAGTIQIPAKSCVQTWVIVLQSNRTGITERQTNNGIAGFQMVGLN